MADVDTDPHALLVEGYLALVQWVPEVLNDEAPDDAVLAHHRALVVQLHEHADMVREAIFMYLA